MAQYTFGKLNKTKDNFQYKAFLSTEIKHSASFLWFLRGQHRSDYTVLYSMKDKTEIRDDYFYAD